MNKINQHRISNFNIKRISFFFCIFSRPTTVSPEDVVIEEDPSALAVTILKDLFCRAHLNNISGCVESALTYE